MGGDIGVPPVRATGILPVGGGASEVKAGSMKPLIYRWLQS